MLDRHHDDRPAVLRMAREYPLRTGLYTVGLPVLGLLHLLNGLLTDVSLLLVGVLFAYAVVCSALLTRHHLAVYRRERLTRDLTERD